MSVKHLRAFAMLMLVGGAAVFGSVNAFAQDKKPNILVIWGDDVGMWNISAYHRGMMSGETPNIDRIAKEGMLFMDHYAQASCTAGRAAFITGQYPLRVGLSTVGLPGSPIGLQKEDPTLADMLKPLGYATGQFGKNHLGDRASSSVESSTPGHSPTGPRRSRTRAASAANVNGCLMKRC
jgi:arylsulfatase A-like enzyme